MDFMASQMLGSLAAVETERDDLRRELHVAMSTIARLESRLAEVTAERDKLRRLDTEAATHVESVICMRTDFSGMGEEVGWKGLGIALKRALDERDRLRVMTRLPEIGDDRPAEQAREIAVEMARRITIIRDRDPHHLTSLDDIARQIEPYLENLLRYSWGAWMIAKEGSK